MTVDAPFIAAILDSLKDPVLVADANHIVCYMNRAALAHYRGGANLLGSSLLDCHNPNSQRKMHEIMAALRQGQEEQLYEDSEKRRVYMRAVRDAGDNVIGYYERFEYKELATLHI